MSAPLPAALVPGRGGLAVRAGVTAYVVLLVAIPLAALAHRGLADGLTVFWAAATSPEALDAFALTLWTAGVVAFLNAIFGTATAWVLVRYRFRGRRLLSAVIDLPFAIPTLVTGLMLVLLFGPQEVLGQWLSAQGISILYSPPAIVLALLFITVPFVVRAVEPVLLELDPAEEEAAHTLGASDLSIFGNVILPAIAPAIALGTLQCFARAIAEFGSIVVVSGNIPSRTLTAPVLIFGEVEGGYPGSAAAVSLLLLSLALALSLGVRGLRSLRSKR
ncbi:MAG: sulfate ABC transporter permease subunit [Anaerolineae bacterium]|nr:sulfate ABC transporter permease subunit [Gemmatimonadaceae bacterium]